jgi:hypothetical protein
MNQISEERTMLGKIDPSQLAVVLSGGLLVVTAFQAALTFGAPFGAAALGGTNSGQLPTISGS